MVIKSKDGKILDLEKKIKLLVETNLLHQKKIELLESEIGVLNTTLLKKNKKKKTKEGRESKVISRKSSQTKIIGGSLALKQQPASEIQSARRKANTMIGTFTDQYLPSGRLTGRSQRFNSTVSKQSIRSNKSIKSSKSINENPPNTVIGKSRERNFDFNKIDNYIETYQPKKKTFQHNFFQPSEVDRAIKHYENSS